MATNFGENIIKVRTERGYSQKELADILNMHATHLSRYERNVTTPSIEVLKKIAEALGVTVDSLIYGKEDEKAKSKIQDHDLLNMFHKVQKLNQQELLCVKSFLEAYLFKLELHQQLTPR